MDPIQQNARNPKRGIMQCELPVVRFGSSRELLAVRSELPATCCSFSAVRSELPETPGTTENLGPNSFGSSILVVHW